MNHFEHIIVAVLKQAMKDYKQALILKDFYKIKELEEFFLSEYGQAMSYYHGLEIMIYCKKCVANGERLSRRTIHPNFNHRKKPK